MPNKHSGWSKRAERNILSVYIRANEYDRDDGLHWYRNAHDSALAFAGRYNVSLETAVGVISALSPGRNWGMNLLEAEDFIREWTKGRRGRGKTLT